MALGLNRPADQKPPFTRRATSIKMNACRALNAHLADGRYWFCLQVRRFSLWPATDWFRWS